MAVVPTVRPEPGTVTVTSLPTVVAVIPVPVKLILFTSEVNTTASSLTVIFDLAIAVIAGVIVSALVFSWENATRIRARKRMKEDGTKIYEIWGPLFFGSISVISPRGDKP